MRNAIHLSARACVIVSVVSMLGACGTTPATGSHPQLARAGDSNAAKVYFLRPDVGYFGLEGLAAGILLDNEKLLSLGKDEYTLVHLQPPGGTVTVETMTVRSEFGKNVARKVRESAQFEFEGGKPHYFVLCKQSRFARAAPTEYSVAPFPIAEHYAQAGASVLKASGEAMHEPLAAGEPIEPDEAHRLLKDVCVAADQLWWYAQQIGRDCVRVVGNLPAQAQLPAETPAAFCQKVETACADRSWHAECTAFIKSYDGKRLGSGYSMLMAVADTRIPRRGSRLTETGDTAFMRFLLDIGFDPNARVGSESKDSVMDLLVPGYLERAKGDGWRDLTPLMIATMAGDRPMVRMLLRAGANPNTQNDQGRTALMYASGVMTLLGERFADIAADLLNAGADPDVRSSGDSGTNALMFAAHHGRADIVRILLARGVNPDAAASDHPGATALMYAANNGHAEVVRMLLDRGASPALADRQGRTALSLAESKGHSEVVQILKAPGRSK